MQKLRIEFSLHRIYIILQFNIYKTCLLKLSSRWQSFVLLQAEVVFLVWSQPKIKVHWFCLFYSTFFKFVVLYDLNPKLRLCLRLLYLGILIINNICVILSQAFMLWQISAVGNLYSHVIVTFTTFFTQNKQANKFCSAKVIIYFDLAWKYFSIWNSLKFSNKTTFNHCLGRNYRLHKVKLFIYLYQLKFNE